MAQIALDRARIDALIGQLVAAGVAQHVRVRHCELGLRTARSTMRAKPAVLKGAPRSDVNTKGDFGSCSRLFHRVGTRNQLSAVLRNMSSRSSEEKTERIRS